METSRGFDYSSRNQELTPLVRGEFKKMSKQQAIECIKNIETAAGEVGKVGKKVNVRFVDGVMELTLVEAKDLLHQIKRIVKAESPEITALFKKVHGQLQQTPPVKPMMPYVGLQDSWSIEMKLKEKKPGVYLVAVPTDVKPLEGSRAVAKVVFAQKNAKPYTYLLDEQPDGKYKLRGKDETYDTLDAFIENRKGPPNYRLTEPLEIDEPYSSIEETLLDLNPYAYHDDLTYDLALSHISKSPPGTYLICDRVKDRDGKVIVYKTENDEVRADVLTLSASPLQGYDCNGQWYPSFSSFMSSPESKQKFRQYFERSLEVRLAEKEGAKSVRHAAPEGIPTWNSTVFNDYRTRLEKNPDEVASLLKKACSEGEFQVMKWLALSHKAPLPSKEGLTEEQCKQIEWLQTVLDMPAPSADDAFLDYAALNVGYGYKGANLMVQEFHAEAINKELKVAKVAVPAKLFFSDFEMRQHLAPIMGELEADWQRFLKTFSDEDVTRMQAPGFDPITDPIQISTDGQKILGEMQDKIALYFTQTPFHSPEFDDWLKSNPSEFYIVRSTGREDTRDNPNPGGNETIPNVKGDPLALSRAMGDVIKSYCGLKSVTQRLMVGDVGLFKEPLFLPVLVMKQVSERVNGEGSSQASIPRSGVMLTRQTGKAEGVTLMQVGLGHNSGVVESKVAVDTYYVDEKLAVREVLREKNSRYLPTQSAPGAAVRLSPAKTDPAFAKEAALQEPVIQDMKRVADYFSKAYGKEASPADMDMEFTITSNDQGRPLINFLQIRPLVEKQALQPSYLSTEKLRALPEQNKVDAHALLGGKASVENLVHASDAMFVDNLPQALSRYLKSVSGSFQAGVVEKPLARATPPKLIFTKQASHLTSHEAIFFRNRGVVIFVVDDQAKVDQLKAMMAKASEACPVKVCSQRGIVLDTHGIDASNIVVDGFASYPIPLEVSIPKNPMLDRKVSQIELGTRIMNINNRFSKLEKELGGQGYITGLSISGLLDKAATTNDPVEAKRAVLTILKRMNQQLTECISGDHPAGATLRLELLHLYNMALKMADSALLPALLGDLQNPQVHMNRLFHLKFFEGLISQKSQEGVVGASSWNQLLKAANREAIASQGIDGSVPRHERATILKTIASLGVNSEVRTEWNSFIDGLAALEDSKYLGQAADLVAEITRLGITAHWMNLIFHDVAREGLSAEKVLEQLVEMKQETSGQLAWAKERLETLSNLRGQVDEWASPEFTEKNINTLRETFTKELEMIAPKETPNFIKRLQESTTLGKLVLLETMRQAIDLYDKTIKAVTGSADYPDNNQLKAQHVTKLLVGYLRMLEGAYKAFTPEKEKELIKHNWMEEGNPPLAFKDMVKYLEYGISDSMSKSRSTSGLVGLLKQAEDPNANFEELLRVNPEFNAKIFIPGSQVDYLYGIAWPKTVEESFTTIHQILEGARRHLLSETTQIGPMLEGRVAALARAIEEKTGQNISNFSMDGSELELVFQIPLRQHSCSLKLQVDVAHPEKGVVLKGETFGAEEYNRWAQTATWGAFFGCLTGRSQPAGAIAAINYDDPRGVGFTIQLLGKTSDRRDERLITEIYTVFNEVSQSQNTRAVNVLNSLNSEVEGDWTENKISDRFFSQCPYLGLNLMDKFAKEENKELLIKAAAGALESLVTYGLDDYVVPGDDDSVARFPDAFKTDPRCKGVAGLQDSDGKSLRIGATGYLLKMLDEEPELARPYVQKLLSNPELQNKLSSTNAVLRAKFAG